MRVALLSVDRTTFHRLGGIARVRFFIPARARLHQEDNSALTAARFSAVRFVLSDEAGHSRVRFFRLPSSQL